MEKELLTKIETELKKLAIEYDRHAKMHKKNANFWLAMLFVQIIFALCLAIL